MPKVIQRKSKVIGIVGSRRRATRDDQILLAAKFREVYKPGDSIVSGGCPTGGDKFAEDIARYWGLSIIIHYPDWNNRKKEIETDELARKIAGFVRNTKIVEQCDILLALVAEDRTGGTEDTIKKALKLKKKVILT